MPQTVESVSRDRTDPGASRPRLRSRIRLGRRGTFWSAGVVLALGLWASGAPSVLYPIYAAEWQLSSGGITTIFGTYPVALLITLLVFGGISDVIGRHRTMLIGVTLIGIAAV